MSEDSVFMTPMLGLSSRWAIRNRSSDYYISCHRNQNLWACLFFSPPSILSPWRGQLLGGWGASGWAGICRDQSIPVDERLSRTPSHYHDQGRREPFQRVNADALLVSLIDVFPVPMQQCVEFFLKSERPAGSSLLFLNPFPCWDEKCNTFQLTLDFLQKYFWKRILHVEHMKTASGW